MKTESPVKAKAETAKVVFRGGAIIKLLDDARLMLAHALECPIFCGTSIRINRSCGIAAR
jgi:hypothetical protein